jgi:hypothetical protein
MPGRAIIGPCRVGVGLFQILGKSLSEDFWRRLLQKRDESLRGIVYK